MLVVLATYPLDTVRLCLIAQAGGEHVYSGAIDCARQLIANEGILSLWSGFFVNVFRAVISQGVISLLNEHAQ